MNDVDSFHCIISKLRLGLLYYDIFLSLWTYAYQYLSKTWKLMWNWSRVSNYELGNKDWIWIYVIVRYNYHDVWWFWYVFWVLSTMGTNFTSGKSGFVSNDPPKTKIIDNFLEIWNRTLQNLNNLTYLF